MVGAVVLHPVISSRLAANLLRKSLLAEHVWHGEVHGELAGEAARADTDGTYTLNLPRIQSTDSDTVHSYPAFSPIGRRMTS